MFAHVFYLMRDFSDPMRFVQAVRKIRMSHISFHDGYKTIIVEYRKTDQLR